MWPDVLSEAEMSRWSHTEVREVLLGRGRKESAEMGIEILLLVLSFKKMYILNSVCNLFTAVLYKYGSILAHSEFTIWLKNQFVRN